MYFRLSRAANPSSEQVYLKSEYIAYDDKVHTNSRGKCSARLKKHAAHFRDEATCYLNIPQTRATSPPQIVCSTTTISPLESMGEPLFYQTSTTNIVMISPSIFMSALFVYLCLTCDHCDTCWTHCTSWGSCWWSFSCFRAASEMQMVVQKDHAELTLLSRWFCNPLIKNPMVEPQCSKHGWAALASPLPLQEVT